MKLTSPLAAALLTALALAAAPTLAADKPAATDKAKSPAAAAPDEAEMMNRWEAAATPGPAHKLLEPLVGEWNIASKWWMAPDAPPMETKGKTTRRWILGGRFVQEDHDGEFMGKPMKGLGLTGYDNIKKKYTNLWIDDGGTAMFTCQGTADASGKVLTFEGKSDDAMSGERNKTLRIILRFVSPDQQVFEMHEPARGQNSKMGEMVYTRK